ncbi:DUF5989 family protein [Pelagibacteraceae bacterium]|nr:DUF5989 family protein [Pelagibacteraceae bacterium]
MNFYVSEKKYWLLPIIIFLFLFGGVIVLSQGSAVAPFIYTIFLPTTMNNPPSEPSLLKIMKI